MNKKGHSVWDVAAWVVLFLLAFWLFLKVTGRINTPLWLQYSPLFGVVYLAGWAMHKLDRATRDISDVKKEVSNVKSNLNSVESDVKLIKNNCPNFKTKL